MKYFAIACWVLTALAALLAVFPTGDNSDAKAGGMAAWMLLMCIFGSWAVISTFIFLVMKLWG